MIKEYDRVVLVATIESAPLEPGDVGTVVHVYPRNAASEVEFVALNGSTAAVATLDSAKVRPVLPTEITHARQVAAA